MAVRVIRAGTFSGYGGLQQTELPTPQPAKARVLVRATAAGVTPLTGTVYAFWRVLSPPQGGYRQGYLALPGTYVRLGNE
jgi:NADPH:quinone reductase-like Zn-dependent oxidoreductase